MILAVDVGNSNIVLGLFDGHASAPPAHVLRLPTHPIGSATELRGRIRAELAQKSVDLDALRDVAVASVVPEATLRLQEALPQARVIDPSWPFSFRIATDPPSRTGIDRLVNAEAAVRERPGAAILVDAGTATTICALTSDRVFLGGAIVPGMELLRDSLAARAAQLFSVELKAPASPIGRDTDSALRSGIVLGYASLIDGMVRRFRAELAARGETSPRVLATGGLSPLLQELCEEIRETDPFLTLKGIRHLYESVRPR